MTCEKCQAIADGVIGGFPEQAGAFWCVPCVRGAGINLPAALAQPYASDDPSADRAAWLAAKAIEKRAKLDAFLASRKAKTPEPVRKLHDPAGPTVFIDEFHKLVTGAPTVIGQMRLI